MNDQDRIDAAEKASADYMPVVSDPGMVRFARLCYAHGYHAALYDYGPRIMGRPLLAASSPLDGRYTQLTQDKLES